MPRMRFLFAALLFAGTASAATIAIETRADGTVVSYDPASYKVDGAWIVLDDEVQYATPQDCTPAGCVKIARWTMQYSCGNRLYARRAVTSLDESGKVIEKKTYNPLIFPIKDTDTTGLALFRAACGSKRRSG